jgi:tRNA nucleotidyltransferase (CCA-adding enzyme)
MTDYNFLLEIRLSQTQFQVLNHITRVATALGLKLYLVGGAVRDITSGQSPIRNLNFVAEGNIQKLFRALERETAGKHGKNKPEGLPSQGTALIESAHFDPRRQEAVLIFAHGVKADVSAAQKELYTKPGRPPEMVPSGIFDDLRCRDFSANAMAISLHPNSRGLLLDPTNGAADIEAREFRALSSRTFFEDPSRIYRLFRLSLRLGFKIEERTQSWLDAALEAKTWEQMTPEQRSRELRDLLQEENPWRVLRTLQERGLASGLDKSLAKLHFERAEKMTSAMRTSPGEDFFILHFDSLTEKLPASQKKKLAERIMPDAKSLKLALSLESEARKLTRTLLSDKGLKPSSVYQLLQSKPHPLLLYTLSHHPQAKVQHALKNFLFKCPEVKEKLPRAELQALGVEPGQRFDAIMNDLFMAVLDGRVKSDIQMIKTLRDLAGVKDPTDLTKPLPGRETRRAAPPAVPLVRAKARRKTAVGGGVRISKRHR